MSGEMAAAIMFSVFVICAFCTVALSNWEDHKERMKEFDVELKELDVKLEELELEKKKHA